MSTGAVAGLVLLVVILAILLPVGLWLLIERETEDQPVMDRGEAERQVRSDGSETQEREGWGGTGEPDEDAARNGWN